MLEIHFSVNAIFSQYQKMLRYEYVEGLYMLNMET